MSKFWSLLLAGALGGLVVLGAEKMLSPEQAPVYKPGVQTAAPARQTAYGAAPVPFDFTKAAERSMDAVVHIKASESKASAMQRQRQSNPFRFFFGDDFYPFLVKRIRITEQIGEERPPTNWHQDYFIL